MAPSTDHVRAVVARHAEATADNRVFFHPDIPEHRLASALSAYPGIAPEDVLVLLDNTDTGSADEGALLTTDALHVRDHGQPPRRFPLADLRTVSVEPGPPRVFEIGGQAVLMHLRVRPGTIERFVAMLRETAEGPNTVEPIGTQPTPSKEKTMDQTNDHEPDDHGATVQSEWTPIPELWTPNTTIFLSFFFSTAFGACINGLNWRALGKPDQARRSFLWMIPGLLPLVLAMFLVPIKVVAVLTPACFVLWYLLDAKQHVAYVEQNVARNYPRRAWVPPVACALVVLALAVFATVARAEWSKATGGNRPPQHTQSVEESLEEQAVGMVSEILSGGYAYSQEPKCIRVKITEEIIDGFYRATATLDTGRDLPITIENKDGTIHVRTEL